MQPPRLQPQEVETEGEVRCFADLYIGTPPNFVSQSMSGKVQLFFENKTKNSQKSARGNTVSKTTGLPLLKLVKSSPISKSYLWIEPRVSVSVD